MPTEHGSADKVIELYWGCLCLLAGLSVELDDPFTSSGGSNPDVIATASDKTTWAFAIKTLAQTPKLENLPKNIVANLEKGLDQIVASRADKGFVVINAKNILDHDSLRQQGPYHTWQEAQARLTQQLMLAIEPFYRDEAVAISQRFETKSQLAPMFAVVAHSTVLAYPTGLNRPMWTEVRTMVAPFLPKPDAPSPGSFGAEALVP